MKPFYGKIVLIVLVMITSKCLAGKPSLSITTGCDMFLSSEKKFFNPAFGAGARIHMNFGKSTMGIGLQGGCNYFINKTDSAGTFLTFPVNLLLNKQINIKSFRISPGLLIGGTGTYLADDKYNSGLFDFKKDLITPHLKIDNKVIKSIIIFNLYYLKKL